METIKTRKGNYELVRFSGGYYGICKKGTNGGECIFGGDSAWEDCYSEELMEDIYKQISELEKNF